MTLRDCGIQIVHDCDGYICGRVGPRSASIAAPVSALIMLRHANSASRFIAIAACSSI